MGSPARPIGVSEPNSATFFPEKLAGIKGVQMGPGATPFTRMPRCTTWRARERVKATIAPFVDA